MTIFAVAFSIGLREPQDNQNPLVALVVIIRTGLMILDIYVLYMFCKGLFFFMIVKAERFHLLDQNFSKCDSFIVLWALALILVYSLTLICRALYSP